MGLKEINKKFVKEYIKIFNSKFSIFIKSYPGGYESFNNKSYGTKTDAITEWNNDILLEVIRSLKLKMNIVDKHGYDLEDLNNNPLAEIKLTTNYKGIGFTCNNFEKYNIFLLIRMKLNKNGIEKLFIGSIDLNKCKSNYSKVHLADRKKINTTCPNCNHTFITYGDRKVDFATLRIHTTDRDKFSVIHGKIKPNKKWCREECLDVTSKIE